MTHRPVRSVCAPLPGRVKPHRLRPVGLTWPRSTSGSRFCRNETIASSGTPTIPPTFRSAPQVPKPTRPSSKVDHGRGARDGGQQDALVHHHPVVTVLGLEGAVERGRDAPVIAGVARDAAGAVRPGERLGVLDAGLHVEVELAQVHRDEEDLHVRALVVGADERTVERRTARRASRPAPCGSTERRAAPIRPRLPRPPSTSWGSSAAASAPPRRRPATCRARAAAGRPWQRRRSPRRPAWNVSRR